MNRRDILKSSAAGAAMALVPAGVAAHAAVGGGGTSSARLAGVFDHLMGELLDNSPETVTSLGLDKGARAGAKARLDDRSLAAWHRAKARNTADLRQLHAFDEARLHGLDVTNHGSILYQTKVQEELNRAIPYVGAQYASPYAVSQLTGSYQGIPDFLNSQHSIETRRDADDYLARLEGFATALDQETEVVRHDVALGVVPPDFILDKTLVQQRALAAPGPDMSNLVQSLVRRTHDKAIAGDWEARAAAIYTRRIQPALGRQIALVEGLRGRAVHTAGVARLPHGDTLYRLMLKNYTTSSMAPEEIHRTGLALIEEQSAQVDAILKGQGLTQGTVGERFRALYDDPQYRYPNTDAGKETLIAYLNTLVAAISAKLPGYFGTLPKAKLDIRRVPKETEAGAPGGYYQPGALDGSRPGAYYINLRDTAEVPRWTLPTLTFHEGIPGHHLQLSLAQQAPLPLIRKIQFFSGYGEGWALYAENLAVEMGMYADNPLGHAGQLHDSIFRAVRLVVDTGMHAMGWSRERAIKFFVDMIGDPESSATTEVERYCVWPGQACSYMLGKLEWLRLRAMAKQALGDRFDIRQFHDAGLLAGAMPLPVLAQRIERYVREAKA